MSIKLFAGLFVCFLAFTGNYAQDENTVIPKACIGCICEAMSNCNTSLGCNGDVCGLFRITWAYWSDAGKPTLNNESESNDGAYARCVVDPFCASRTLEGYMKKFARDCNGDGVINCDDYVRIHRYGANGCTNQLPQKNENDYRVCMQTYG